MGSRHREMPQIQFSADEAILNSLGSVTGIAHTERAVIQHDDADGTVPP
jgi:hypothetical protein